MAMTKKEQAEMEELRQRVREERAFRRTEPVEPDVPIPEVFTELSRGFTSFACVNVTLRSGPGCSSSTSHGDSWEGTRSQQPKRLFSTQLNAMKAARHKLEVAMMKELARIDALIEAEQKNPTPGYKESEQ